ncbi:hypothetical protein QNO09_12820 [Streptomyces sp. 378]|uniref:hypothetical protein n=1 Tax=Streptomyces sp. 378 TaxID=3049412 RepID=UPI0024C40142|nr:hypothetical protein [Streptomyces sp. 378]MDK1344169.1 hypothetical protein [Streptomyces sp. 378]
MSHQLKTIPALDTTPTGRALPFLVEEPCEHVEDPEQAARVEVAVDRIMGALIEHGRKYTAETLHQVLAREAAERDAGRPGRPCDVYDWCDEVDTHDDHSGPEFMVRSFDQYGEPLVFACVTDVGDEPPAVSFMGDDLNPEQARITAARLRELADAMDGMADTVEAIEPSSAQA